VEFLQCLDQSESKGRCPGLVEGEDYFMRECNMHPCDWGPFGNCSETCGLDGVQERVCLGPAGSCSGSAVAPCNIRPCEWTEWSACLTAEGNDAPCAGRMHGSAKAGGHINRTCLGSFCIGDASAECNMQECDCDVHCDLDVCVGDRKCDLACNIENSDNAELEGVCHADVDRFCPDISQDNTPWPAYLARQARQCLQEHKYDADLSAACREAIIYDYDGGDCLRCEIYANFDNRRCNDDRYLEYGIPNTNVPLCGFDGGDCCTTLALDYEGEEDDVLVRADGCHDPGDACPNAGGDYATYADGICNDANNIYDCYWDGGDCCAEALNVPIARGQRSPKPRFTGDDRVKLIINGLDRDPSYSFRRNLDFFFLLTNFSVTDRQETQFSECTNCACLDPAQMHWGPWGECSVSCGGGGTIRRECAAEQECEGDSTRGCDTRPCEWLEWGPCSEPCGGGITRRACERIGCEGEAELPCNEQPCPEPTASVPDSTDCGLTRKKNKCVKLPGCEWASKKQSCQQKNTMKCSKKSKRKSCTKLSDCEWLGNNKNGHCEAVTGHVINMATDSQVDNAESDGGGESIAMASALADNDGGESSNSDSSRLIPMVALGVCACALVIAGIVYAMVKARTNFLPNQIGVGAEGNTAVVEDEA